MADSKEHVGALASAGASLRDTAKWLAGGIFATAAGIFAGSSLTQLGSLGPNRNPDRLLMAIVGALVGFAALGLLLRRLMSVLTMESASLDMLADAEGSPEDPFHSVAKKVSQKYGAYFPAGTATLRQAIDRFDDAKPDSVEWENARQFSDIVTADAGFLAVRQKFERLKRALPWAGGLAVLGFGLFAWAANPPEAETPGSEGTAPSIEITVATKRVGPTGKRRNCQVESPRSDRGHAQQAP